MITATQSSQAIKKYTQNVGVIPVLVIDSPSLAVDLAKVLVGAGLPVLEVTLRTPNALEVIEKMASVEGAIIAAGTVLDATQVASAKSAGADFIVSPGYTESLSLASMDAGLPLLPGAVTASEAMQMMELGFTMLKFFPAEANGGIPSLKSLAGPLPQVSFCPTGGINTQNVDDYLALPNVVCVGGSWLVTPQDLDQKDWKNIERKAQALRR